jgi:hypothetical protein
VLGESHNIYGLGNNIERIALYSDIMALELKIERNVKTNELFAQRLCRLCAPLMCQWLGCVVPNDPMVSIEPIKYGNDGQRLTTIT